MRGSASVAILLFARHAGAEEARLPAVEYVAPKECPDQASFQRGLARRLTAKPATPPPPRDVRLRIERHGELFTGELRVRDGDAAPSVRSVTAASCAELVDAMAFLAAVALTLSTEPAPPPASITVTPPATAAPTPTPRRWRFAAGAEATVVSWVGPSPRIAPEPFLEVRREGSGLFAPTLRLSGTIATSGDVPASSGSGFSTFTLTAARLEGCPIAWQPVPSVRLAPCVGLRAGALEGVGEDIAGNHGDTHPWLSAELLGRAEWAPVPWLFFELAGGGALPVFRYRYFFDPDLPITETPVLGWFVGAGGGFRVPW